MRILDGKLVSGFMLEKITGEVCRLSKKPKLTVLIAGKDSASLVYVRNKQKACEKVGILWKQINLNAATTTTESLIKKIQKLNSDSEVNGILVQVPLPKHIYLPEVIKAINPYKDVDGFHAYNLGKTVLSSRFEELAPCTPKGIIKLLEYYDVSVRGMDVTVIGHSNIVGKPVSAMLLNRGATVTICHIDTRDLKSHTEKADLVVVAVGKVGLLTADMVKKGAIVIDVGMNRVNGKLVGDCDFERIAKKASYITPVPGGVGPMTVACLMENTLIAYKKQLNQ